MRSSGCCGKHRLVALLASKKCIMSRVFALASLLSVLLTSACANLGVEPWDRDLLATPAMQLDADPIAASLDDHIYFSKEASSGGRSFGGGGCGCN